MAITDRFSGSPAGPNLAIKQPVRVATTANITLSGTQTIDGVSAVADDRVLVKNQTDTTENGIYIVSSGAWSRAPDFDGPGDIAKGTVVFVSDGSTLDNTIWKISTTDPSVGSALAFTQTGLEGPAGETGPAGPTGATGATGPAGADGNGAGDMLGSNNLSELTDAATARTNIGLGSVDNTSDAGKPVSTAQQTALDLKANLASPALTGTPTAPTAGAGTNTTQVATTAYVTQAVADAGGASTTLGAVGTYALCCTATGISFVAGTTYAGSNLVYASASGAGTTAPSGTWRAMGAGDGTNASAAGTTLFVRTV